MPGTRRYQLLIGAIGLALVVAFSVYLDTRGNSRAHPGVLAGRPLPHFVAPLATSGLNVPANVDPRCDPSRPARRGLNVCGRRPIVLAFFVPGAQQCIRAVSTLQRLAARFPGTTFAAVAAGGGEHATAALVHAHHWTIPVADDPTAAVAQLYGVAVCPLIEVAGSDGLVRRLLIGDRWERPAALAATLRKVLSENR